LQDIAADGKIMVNLRRRTEKSSTVSLTKLLRKQHFSFSKADIEAKDNSEWTALHHAADEEYKIIVRLLVKKEADVEAKEMFGLTALHYAADKRHEAVMRLLIEKGVDIEAKDGFR
jgi:ankyrin repeat protein